MFFNESWRLFFRIFWSYKVYTAPDIKILSNMDKWPYLWIGQTRWAWICIHNNPKIEASSKQFIFVQNMYASLNKTASKLDETSEIWPYQVLQTQNWFQVGAAPTYILLWMAKVYHVSLLFILLLVWNVSLSTKLSINVGVVLLFFSIVTSNPINK